MKFKRGNDPCSGELSYKPLKLGAMVDTQERMLAFFALDCHYMKMFFHKTSCVYTACDRVT